MSVQPPPSRKQRHAEAKTSIASVDFIAVAARSGSKLGNRSDPLLFLSGSQATDFILSGQPEGEQDAGVLPRG